MWQTVIYRNRIPNKILSENQEENENLLTSKIAEGLFNDILPRWNKFSTQKLNKKPFTALTVEEKSFWVGYASEIPGKLKILNLFIRPYEVKCRTCIITEQEIETLIKIDQKRYCRDLSAKRLKKSNSLLAGINPSFKYRISDLRSFFIEMNYLIPFQIKKLGFEIIRYEEVNEIDMSMIKKLARAIHSRYLNEIRKQSNKIKEDEKFHLFYSPEDTVDRYASDFDDLPDEIKHSNIDNAAHIPTKLLSIGYKIRQVKKGFQTVTLHLNKEEIETMARVEHLRWSWEKRLDNWIYGKTKNNTGKTHPSLIPYDDLSESEKDKDRELVRLIPAFLKDINFEVFPVSPNRINKLSYAIKPQSNIHRLLNETRQLSDEVNHLTQTSPEIHDKINSINKKIEETIIDVQGSYNYARQIQEIFLPEDLYIRECFPDSFVLYKPKNIISGDFYFFSKKGDLVFFALADCTGHGIPGALISTIGYGTLDQVVNVKNISDPAEILHNLFSSIHRFLRRNLENNSLHDDMDITMCILDTRNNLLSFAGVGNMIYIISDGNIEEVKSDYYKDDCNIMREYSFTTRKIQLYTGNSLYICSDGYTDQFGGAHRKRYQRSRLKNLLMTIRESPMAEQADILNEEIEKWREQNDEEQTDDISVIGIKI